MLCLSVRQRVVTPRPLSFGSLARPESSRNSRARRRGLGADRIDLSQSKSTERGLARRPDRRLLVIMLASLCLHAPAEAARAESAPICRSGGPPGAGRFLESAPIQLGQRQRDVRCFLSPTEMRSWTQRGPVEFIDVRAADRRERLRAPRGLAISLRLLPYKTYLRGRQLVLISDEPSTDLFERGCHALRAAGFERVAALDGGLRAWASEHGEFADSVPGADTLAPQSFTRPSAFSQTRRGAPTPSFRS